LGWTEAWRIDLGHVFTLLADGSLKANIAARFPLDDVAAALTQYKEVRISGGAYRGVRDESPWIKREPSRGSRRRR
jgi:hypothetical protein